MALQFCHVTLHTKQKKKEIHLNLESFPTVDIAAIVKSHWNDSDEKI